MNSLSGLIRQKCRNELTLSISRKVLKENRNLVLSLNRLAHFVESKAEGH